MSLLYAFIRIPSFSEISIGLSDNFTTAHREKKMNHANALDKYCFVWTFAQVHNFYYGLINLFGWS